MTNLGSSLAHLSAILRGRLRSLPLDQITAVVPAISVLIGSSLEPLTAILTSEFFSTR